MKHEKYKTFKTIYVTVVIVTDIHEKCWAKKKMKPTLGMRCRVESYTLIKISNYPIFHSS